MLSLRVFRRVNASLTSSTGLLHATNARQRVAARTYLTTASVASPAAKSPKGNEPAKTEAAPQKKRRTSAEVQEARTAREQARAAKQKEKAAKEKAKAKAAADKAKARDKAKAKAEKLKDPGLRLKAPLKSIKLNKDELPPKRPPTAYNIFVQEIYSSILPDHETNGDHDAVTTVFKDRIKLVSERWNNMTEDEKKPYREKEQEARAQYERDAEEWYRTTDPRIIQAVRAQRKTTPEKPIEFRRPLSPFIKFSIAKQGELKVPEGLNGTESVNQRGKQLSEMWRNVPAEEKARMSAEYKKDLEVYREQMKQRQGVSKA